MPEHYEQPVADRSAGMSGIQRSQDRGPLLGTRLARSRRPAAEALVALIGPLRLARLVAFTIAVVSVLVLVWAFLRFQPFA